MRHPLIWSDLLFSGTGAVTWEGTLHYKLLPSSQQQHWPKTLYRCTTNAHSLWSPSLSTRKSRILNFLLPKSVCRQYEEAGLSTRLHPVHTLPSFTLSKVHQSLNSQTSMFLLLEYVVKELNSKVPVHNANKKLHFTSSLHHTNADCLPAMGFSCENLCRISRDSLAHGWSHLLALHRSEYAKLADTVHSWYTR